MKFSVPVLFVAEVASQDVFLTPRISNGMTVGSGKEVDAQDDSCLNFLNGLRAQNGLSPLTLMSSQMSCAANQAQGDATTSAHEHFGACGEGGQCEAMWSGTDGTCEQGIQMYYDEGPGGGHYDIIMSSDYQSMSYGYCNNCGSYGTFYTHDFFWGSAQRQTPAPTVVASQDELLAPQISNGMIVGSGMEVDAQDDSCLNFLNGLRAQNGLSPLTLMSSQMSCAANQAQGDATTSAHEHFGACGEGGQCEAMWSGTDGTCEQGIQMYYDEGPGGGHYDIIMSSDYQSMSYGYCNNCGSYGTFYTHDFFWGSAQSQTPPAH